ncbi:putative enzyme [Streptomyces sp. KY75]|nr:putative enzyme [Streptomyces sp. KY75]
MGIGTGIGTGIGITEEHRALAHSVRGWLARAVPPGEVRKLLDAGSPAPCGVRPAYWEALAGQGLAGIHLPEEYGGGGGGLLDLAVVLEEAAYGSLPGPYLATALTGAVVRRATGAGAGDLVRGPHRDLVRDLLRGLAAGERTAALALTPGTLTATPAEGGHRLDGAAPPVLSGEAADLLLLPAAEASGGVLWFLVDAGAKGLTVRPHRSVDPTRPTAEVRADAVLVPAHRTLPLDSALVRDLAAVLLAADACGTAARSLDTAAEHARVREQFGRPIGAFQAVKHLCADMLVRLEQARALTWDAARAADEPSEVRELTAALAAATAPEAAYSCAKDAIQILGGIGFTWEHGAHLQLRRAVLARQLLGAASTTTCAPPASPRPGRAANSPSNSPPRPPATAQTPAPTSPPPGAWRPARPAVPSPPPATPPRTCPPRTGWARAPYNSSRSSRS